jgi:hypothetical protein
VTCEDDVWGTPPNSWFVPSMFTSANGSIGQLFECMTVMTVQQQDKFVGAF